MIIWRIIRWTGWLLAIVSVGLLLLCYLAYWIPPHINSFLPLVGLAYPFVMPIVAGLAIMAAILKSRATWVLSVIWILGLPHFFSYYQIFNNDTTVEQQNACIKVMSWNVNLLGYNRANQLVDLKSSVIRDSIVKVITMEDPDFLAFQEFLQTQELDHIGLIKEQAGFRFHHVRFSTSKRNGRKTGLVLFSKYPIVQSGQVMFSGATMNGCIFMDVVKERDTLRVYNAHLQSIRFNQEDYEYLEDENEEVGGAARIMQRLQKAFLRREGQVHAIQMHMKTSPYPVILMGDFNDPPMSYTYRKLTEGMMDTFREKGHWMSSTYAGKFPNFRIDYILAMPSVGEVQSYETMPIELIDHRPVVVTLKIDPV